MKKPDLWMPLYIADYLADTQRLTTEGHGAYLLLIMDYWMAGPLPNDDSQLAAVTKLGLKEWKRMRPKLAPFFSITDGSWRHKRVDLEKGGAQDIIDKRSKAGTAGAAKRWQTHAGANGKDVANAVAKGMAESMASAKQTDGPTPNTPTPKPKPEIQKLSSGKPDLPPGFARFWTAWPKGERKQGKPKCLAIWKRKSLEGKADSIVSHVEKLTKSDSWRRGFDPMPTTYLNEERWDGADMSGPELRVAL